MIEPTKEDIGRAVIYKWGTSYAEQGIITSFNDKFVFVKYGKGMGECSQSTSRKDLVWKREGGTAGKIKPFGAEGVEIPKEEEKKTDESFECLLTLGWYNGHDKHLDEIYAHLQQKLEGDFNHYSFPDFLQRFDHDQYLRIVWSFLVLKYGDYGTSPRFGWVNQKDIKIVLNTFEKWKKEMK